MSLFDALREMCAGDSRNRGTIKIYEAPFREFSFSVNYSTEFGSQGKRVFAGDRSGESWTLDEFREFLSGKFWDCRFGGNDYDSDSESRLSGAMAASADSRGDAGSIPA